MISEEGGRVFLQTGDEVCTVYGVRLRITGIIEFDGDQDDLISTEVIEDEKISDLRE
jgi:hypothetical protein